jgi:hypothetical protein
VELEDFEDLVDLAVATEKRLLFSELGEDAADSPDIDSQTILLLPEQHLGGPVPEGLDLMREGLDGETEGPGKSKVSDLEGSGPVNEQILRFEVPMDDPAGVAVVYAVAKLVEEQLHLVSSHGMFVLTQIFLHVVFDQLEDEVEFLLTRNVHHFLQPA